MNRILLLITIVLVCMTMQAQEENVIIDGVTFSADRKVLIKYPEGKTDKEYVIPEGTEVIGEVAFQWNSNLQRISIPTTLNEIRNMAFMGCYKLSTIVWGTYPNVIGEMIFGENASPTPVSEFILSEANVDCALVDGLLFSIDKKTLFLVPPGIVLNSQKYSIPEGTEAIRRYAFYGVRIEQVTLPSSLKSIEDYAFWSYVLIPTGAGSPTFSLGHVISNAIIPPIITRKSFASIHSNFYYPNLSVPEEAFENYASSELWKRFESINGVYVSIKNINDNKTEVKVEGQRMQVTGENVISKLNIFTPNGLKVQEKIVSTNSCSFDLDKSIHGVFLLEVYYENGIKDVFKLIIQ